MVVNSRQHGFQQDAEWLFIGRQLAAKSIPTLYHLVDNSILMGNLLITHIN